MTFSTYADLNRKMTEHFQAGEFRLALELIEREGGNFPKERLQVDYWRMCAAARTNDRARVIEVAEIFHKDGLWFGEMMWRLTPSFKPLQGDAEFERIVAKSMQIQAKDVFARTPIMLEFTPRNASKKSPLLIALHGNQSTADGTLPFWNPVVEAGFVLAVPQSTQAMFTGACMWDDLDASFQRVKNCFDTLKKSSEFDPKRVILAGHSMGGLVAIQMAMTGEIPVCGFVVNCPALPFEDTPEELDIAIASAKERGLRGYFIVGEKDVDIEQDAIRAFVERMKAAEIPCELETVLGATHDYNPEYDAALARGLKFVNL